MSKAILLGTAGALMIGAVPLLFGGQSSGGGGPSTPAVGQLQYGPNFTDYWSGTDPFLNVLSQYDPVYLRTNFGADFDEATGEISGMNGGGPTSVGWLRFSREIGAPEGYFDNEFIFEWDGDGTFILSSSDLTDVTFVDDGPNRKRLQVPVGHNVNLRIQLTAVGATPVSNWRCYEARNEARVLAGEIFRPEYLSMLEPYSVLRPMNWSGANSTAENKTSQLYDIPHPAWGRLVPLEAQIRLAIDTGSELWLNVPPALGAPDEVTTEAFLDPPPDDGNPAPAWQQEQDFWRAKGAEHAPTVFASDEFLTYARRIVTLLNAAGYPANRAVYFELGNEIWNFGSGFTRQSFYYTGLGETVGGDIGRMGALGYRLAKLALAVEQAWDEASSTRPWKVVFGSQTANPDRTFAQFGGGVLNGCDEYFTEIAGTDPTAKTRLASHIAGTTTNYLYGAFSRIDFSNNLYNDQNSSTYYASMAAEIQSDADGLSQRIVDLFTTGTDGRHIDWVVRQAREHADRIEAWGGVYLGMYEGSNHDTYEGSDSVIQAFAQNFFQSTYNAEIMRETARQFFAEFPGKILSDYCGPGRMQPNRAWIEGPPGVDTPARAVWAEIAGTLV